MAPASKDIRFEEYTADRFMAVHALFKTVWGANRSVEYDEKHWNKTLTGVCPAVAAFSGEQAVGFYMVWPVPLTDGRAEVLGGQPIDSMVHAGFQGRGMLRELGCRCYELCSQKNMSVMFGAPNRAAYAGNVGALNWCHVSNIVDLVRPLIGRLGRRANWVEQQGRWVCAKRIAGKLVSDAARNGPSELAGLWSGAALHSRRWQAARTGSWMSYRYDSVPEAEYFTLTLREGETPRAAAICGLRKAGSHWRATLADLVAADKSARAAMLKTVASFAHFKGARFLFAKTTAADLDGGLHWNGFIPFRRTPLISRTLGWRCFSANAYSPKGWALSGGAFDLM